jgi:hypothetical protein
VFWWKADIAILKAVLHRLAMIGFQCWFCGEGIDRDDDGALLVSVEGLWRWAEGGRRDDGPFQNLYVHSHCAKERMAGATMNLEPSVFGEED